MTAPSSFSQTHSSLGRLAAKLKWVPLGGALCIIALLLFSASASSTVTEATLFRAAAKLLESRKLALRQEGKGIYRASFVLPAQADPESLIAWPASGSQLHILNLKWQPVAPADTEDAGKIRNELLSVRVEKNRLRAQLQALEAQMQFWQLQTKAKVKTLSEAQNLSSALGRQIRRTSEEKMSVEQELQRLEGRIRNLEENLDRIVKDGLPSWEVTALLAGPRSSETTLFFSYTVSGCGWLPLYRLNARPGLGQIIFSREVEIWQETGQDWSGVSLMLSSHKPGSGLLPPKLSPWSIAPPSPSAPADGRRDDMESPDLLSVGKGDLPSGTRKIVEIGKESWPADFTFLARPGTGSQIFLQAAVKDTVPRNVQPGQAIFLNEGAYAGKRNFSLTANKEMISFGPDPLVHVIGNHLTDLSCVMDGTSGRKVCDGQWHIEIRNDRSRPVTVRIEASQPQAGDERIQLSLQSALSPAEQDEAKIVWVLPVPAGGNAGVMTHLRLSAPQDLEIDFGRW